MDQFTKKEVETLESLVEQGYFLCEDSSKSYEAKVTSVSLLLKNPESKVVISKERVLDTDFWILNVDGKEPEKFQSLQALVRKFFFDIKKPGFEIDDFPKEGEPGYEPDGKE